MDWKTAFDDTHLTLAQVAKRLGYKSTGTISDLVNKGKGSERLKEAFRRMISEIENPAEVLSLNETPAVQNMDAALLRLQRLRAEMHEGITQAEQILLNMNSKKTPISYDLERKQGSVDSAKVPVPEAVEELIHGDAGAPSASSPPGVPPSKLSGPKRHNIE
jgi:hypothetical protein